ncbi:MAG: molybdenum cofactor biosynthesis protein MoeB [Euryarchaeota archaeon]|nr:molybdenum cofactor biosynthesis protein MoeB [Euryarchaeota archaeon]OUW22874.1 MAG: hypothetical protein CBD33_00855 [Euryarchaeota archaeon TMED173]
MAYTFRKDQLERYARHLVLPGVGEEGQSLMLDSSVLVIGAGGLGSPALMYLAAAGIGRIGVMDHDIVSSSNLQRQIIHSNESLGLSKVRSAASWIRNLNEDVDIIEIPEKLTRENSLSIFEDFDVIIDGTDNFETRYLINDSSEITGKPWVFGSIHRFEGQVSTFNVEDGPNYRDLFPESPPPELAPNCSEAGVLGVLPGIVGTIQATEAIKLILGIGDILRGKLLTIDALTMKMKTLSFSKNKNRIKASELEKRIGSSFSEILPIEFFERKASGWEPYVLDVRTSEEEAISSIRGTDSRIMHLDVPVRLEELPREKEIVIYCRSGQRSALVARLLGESGWSADRVFNLVGGINRWSEEVDHSINRY